MNVLTGLYHPDEGEIEVAGRLVELLITRRDRRRDRDGAQHFRLVEPLTVADNLALSMRGEPFLRRRREVIRQVELISEALHLPIDPTHGSGSSRSASSSGWRS